MTDRGAITGSFIWTPPTGDVPPLTITKVLTMSAPSIVTHTPPKAEKANAAETPFQQTVFEFSLVQEELESSTLTATSVLIITQTTIPVNTNPLARPISYETEPSLPTSGLPPSENTSTSTSTNNMGSLLTTMTITVESSIWTTSFIQTFQTPETSITGSDSTLPLETITLVAPPLPIIPETPTRGLTKITLIGISVGGVVAFVATIIGLIMYIQSRRKTAGIKGNIGRPVQPIPEKRLSEVNEGGWLFQGLRSKRISQDSQTTLARSATSSTGMGSQGPSPPSYSNTFPQVQITPSSPHGILPDLTQETITPIGPLRPNPRVSRRVSSVYVDTLDDDVYRDSNVYGVMNLEIRGRDSNYPPYPNQAMSEISQMSSRNPYHNIENPYRDTQISFSSDTGENLYQNSGLLHVPSSQSRNLMVPNPARRRNRPVSSWMSNNYYETGRVNNPGSERSSVSDFTSVFEDRVGQNIAVPILHPLASTLDNIDEGGHGIGYGAPISAYGDSILGYYENNDLEGIDEGVEGATEGAVTEDIT